MKEIYEPPESDLSQGVSNDRIGVSVSKKVMLMVMVFASVFANYLNGKRYQEDEIFNITFSFLVTFVFSLMINLIILVWQRPGTASLHYNGTLIGISLSLLLGLLNLINTNVA